MNKKSLKYILFFIFSFITLLLFNDFRYDTIYNFGFSSSIANNEIPYKDLNLVMTPLYQLIMSLGLIIKNTFIVYILEQSLLLTIFYYVLNKLIDNKTNIILYIMTFAYFIVL